MRPGVVGADAEATDKHCIGVYQFMPNMEEQFDAAMMSIYLTALRECGYNATRYLQMLHEHRGLGTARRLLHSSTVSEGYVKLWEFGRLDLTVEALVLRPEWAALFSDEERAIASQRLQDYGFEGPR